MLTRGADARTIGVVPRVLRLLAVVACLALPLAFASTVHAAGNPDYTSNPDYTAVPPTTPPPTTAPPAPAHREMAAPPPPRRDRLAVTGSDVLQTGMIGVALVAVGGVVVLATRRRSAT
ncbi:MAG: hypothetical protein JWN46_347 [Acidimicrobiales bacterium]|nr:hypothetical protein [Acidimicrobiales bacterium]